MRNNNFEQFKQDLFHCLDNIRHSTNKEIVFVENDLMRKSFITCGTFLEIAVPNSTVHCNMFFEEYTYKNFDKAVVVYHQLLNTTQTKKSVWLEQGVCQLMFCEKDGSRPTLDYPCIHFFIDVPYQEEESFFQHQLPILLCEYINDHTLTKPTAIKENITVAPKKEQINQQILNCLYKFYDFVQTHKTEKIFILDYHTNRQATSYLGFGFECFCEHFNIKMLKLYISLILTVLTRKKKPISAL